MAPAANIPELDMSSIQNLDILQSYWLLFKHMKEDFVHKDDLKVILQSNTLLGEALPMKAFVVSGAAVFPAIASDVIARAKAMVYSGLAKTGGIATEEAIKALEALTS